MKHAKIVKTKAAWEKALEELREKEKALTRERDALAAERRRLPRVRIEKDYVFEGPDGKASLVDLFDGRRQLLLYHFMFGPNQEAGCDGCSMVVDQIGHPAHLHARDTSFALVSRAPIAKLEAYRKRMGWSHSVVLVVRDRLQPRLRRRPRAPRAGPVPGRRVVRPERLPARRRRRSTARYFTTVRGVEALGSVWTFLDLTPFGRQEEWEDSPEGYPQTPPYEWWRRHDEYGA